MLASYLVRETPRPSRGDGIAGNAPCAAPEASAAPAPPASDVRVYELRHASCRFGAWFVGDRVSSERGATLASAIDPVFLAVPALLRAEKAGMLSVEDLFERFLFEAEQEADGRAGERGADDEDGCLDEDGLCGHGGSPSASGPGPDASARSRARAALARAVSRGAALECVCETRRVDADAYVRVSRRRLAGWLAAKARRAAEAMRRADPAGWEGFGDALALEAGMALVDEWLPDAKEWGAGQGGSGARESAGGAAAAGQGATSDLLQAVDEARKTARTLLGLPPVAASEEPSKAPTSPAPGAENAPGSNKRPRDPAQAARDKAAASRLATKEAKRKKDAQGTRKLSGFFRPAAK